MGKWGLVSAGILLWVASFVTSTPLVVQAGDDIIGDVRAQLAQNGFSAAESELRTYKAQHGVTPEYLEALSWMARGAAATKQWDQAAAYASETRVLSEQQLTQQPTKQRPNANSTPNLICPSRSAPPTKFSLREWMRKDSTRKRSACCARLWRAMEIHPFERGSRRTSTCWLWSANPLRPYK